MKDEALWLKDEKKRLKVRQENKGFSSDAIGKLKRLRQTAKCEIKNGCSVIFFFVNEM